MKDDTPLVLVVDDLPDAADLLASMLQFDGYSAVSAYDADSALKLCAEQLPHCALIDIHMPGTNGVELAQRLRELYPSDLVLIAVTGWGQSDERVSTRFDCFDYYMRKPITPEQLRKILPPIAD